MPSEPVSVEVRQPWWRRRTGLLVAVGAAAVAVALILVATLRTTGDGGEAGPSPEPSAPTAAARLLGEQPRLWDDFARADASADIAHDRAPSGQAYTTTHGGGSAYLVRGGRLVPTGVGPRRAAIVYADLDDADSIGLEWVWTPGDEGHQNVIIGASGNGFGRGSVQLAVYQDEWPQHPGLRWALFYVPVPIVDPYPVIASGPLPDAFVDSATRYRVAMRRTATDEVTLSLPDGSTEVVRDAAIAASWGDRIGWQLRRPLAEDGAAEFTLFAAA